MKTIHIIATLFATTLLASAEPANLAKLEPSILGLKLQDDVEKFVNKPELAKARKIERAFNTPSFLSSYEVTHTRLIKKYKEEVEKIQKSEEEERSLVNSDKMWKITAWFEREDGPALLGLHAEYIGITGRYFPDSKTFHIEEISVWLGVPYDANQDKTTQSVIDTLTQQFGKAEGEGDRWSNLGENKARLWVRGGGGQITLTLKSEWLSEKTEKARKERLAELQKPAPVQGKLE